MNAQGTQEWLQERCGCVTASRFGDVLATTKSGYAASRQNYLTQLVLERLTGTVAESFTNAAMERGTEMEPVARAAFEAKTGLLVEEVGFIKMGEWIGCSADGIIGTNAGLEIKAPNSATHLETLLAQRVPPKYIPQIQGCMLVTGREEWHFFEFDDRFPSHLQIFHQVVPRDYAFIDNLCSELDKFLAEVATAVERLSAF